MIITKCIATRGIYLLLKSKTWEKRQCMNLRLEMSRNWRNKVSEKSKPENSKFLIRRWEKQFSNKNSNKKSSLIKTRSIITIDTTLNPGTVKPLSISPNTLVLDIPTQTLIFGQESLVTRMTEITLNLYSRHSLRCSLSTNGQLMKRLTGNTMYILVNGQKKEFPMPCLKTRNGLTQII